MYISLLGWQQCSSLCYSHTCLNPIFLSDCPNSSIRIAVSVVDASSKSLLDAEQCKKISTQTFSRIYSFTRQ